MARAALLAALAAVAAPVPAAAAAGVPVEALPRPPRRAPAAGDWPAHVYGVPFTAPPLPLTPAFPSPPPSPCNAFGNASTDWLVTPCPVPSTLTPPPAGAPGPFVLSNGIVSRTLAVDPASGQMYTARLTSVAAGGAEKLAAVVAEAALEVNGVPAYVGGAATGERVRFTFAGWRQGAPAAGGFVWTPGSRGTPPSKPWPPAGVRAEFDHVAPCAALGAPGGPAGSVVTATVVYELYDGTSTFGKRVALTHNCSAPLFVFNLTVSMLATTGGGAVETQTDAAIAEPAIAALDNVTTVFVNRFLPIAASHAYDASLPAFGPGLSFFPAGANFTSYLVVEVVHDGDPPSPTSPHGMTRYGLETSRMWRTLAPQVEQFPLAGNAMCVGGRQFPAGDPRVGAWCYDDEGTAGLEAYIDQAAALGFEMVDVSLDMNATWRSQVGVEFQPPANVTWFKALVDRARGAGLELGAYQLLRNARSATAINQCAPGNAFLLPGDGFDDQDLPAPLGTGLACHNGGNARCVGGPGCCSLCAGNEWYDAMEASVFAFWDGTGMTVTEQDGAESNSPCANASHVHHHGLNDSVWVKWGAVHRTFRGYLARGGWVQGMPGHFLEGGQAKLPGGYDEMTWSLPRWTWIHRQRERMISDPQWRDRTMSNALRYFIIPFTPYHPVETAPGNPNWVPVTGLTSSATLEPLDDHTVELEWALSQSWGTGIFTNMRGVRLAAGAPSTAVLAKWVAFVKKYRAVVTTEFVTLNNSTVCWGPGQTLPNGTCTVSGWDGILHRAPAGFHPGVRERGLAMVWNPLNATLPGVALALPLYYAGLVAPASAAVRQEEGPAAVLPVGPDGTVAVPPVTLPPLSVTYFVVEDAPPPARPAAATGAGGADDGQ
jgi:hypothetical protein